ncbi:hypothetical protein CH262_20335 [Rhodococcus sp. 05-2255-1e]|uniref:lipopolysaccharide biosynthesis protein n=1 Tax=Rhodococcus sp. 05-2255-1e TaxID=2022495 RepID=UPI000B9BEAD8|nr:hypothetical protein CH262_20335 [Rhodococcus sp. 05-2255-1e]
MPKTRRLSEYRNYAKSLIAYSLNPVVGLVTGPILAHSLGPDGRGQLAAILQPLTLADSFAAIGIPTAVVYFIAQRYDRAIVSRLAYRGVAFTSISVYCVLTIYATRIAQAQNIGISLVLLAWLSVIFAALASVRRAKHAAVSNWRVLDAERMISACLRLVTIAGLGIGSVDQLSPFVAAYLLSGICAYSVLVTPTPGLQKNFGRPISTAKFAKFSGVTALSTIALAASNRLDQAVLPIAISSRELGLYAVAVTLAEIPLIAATVSSRNMLSASATERGTSKLRQTLGMSVAAVGVCAVAISMAGSYIVSLLFGSEFSDSAELLRILLIGTVFTSISSVLAAYITGQGYPLSAASIFGANVIFLFFAYISKWGEINAQYAASVSSASQIVSTSVGIVLVLRTVRKRRQAQSLIPVGRG